jgi:type I restriction enzyme S subunit
MEERRLPLGWAFAELGDLIDADGLFSDGDWVESKDQDPNGSIRLLQLADIGEARFIDKSNRFVNDEQFERLRCTEVFEGDILVARMPDPLGRACLVPKLGSRLITVVDVAIIRLGSRSLLPTWLMHAINSPFIRGEIEIQSTGTTRRRISRKKLSQLTFPIPPLNEQRRIAAKLDGTLAAADACRQRLDGVEALLKRFRQAVLAAATSGELTREWREERGAEEAMRFVSLGEVILEMRNGLSPKPSLTPPGVKILRIGAVRPGTIDFDDCRYLDLGQGDIRHFMLQNDDLIFTRYNGTLEFVGVCALVRQVPGVCVYPDKLIRVRCKHEVALPAYVELAFGSVSTRIQIESLVKSSAGQKGVSGADLKGIRFGLPSIPEQEEIVRRTQQLFSLADQLEARLTSARQIVERLTPALLAKAFRGELVPQDPNDEPASVLLERIRAARQADAAAGKPSRRGHPKAAANPVESVTVAAPVTPDLLASLLRECGALSERALLAASELDHRSFDLQLEAELKQGRVRRVDDDGQVLMEAAD